jgi:hypothetical protein
MLRMIVSLSCAAVVAAASGCGVFKSSTSQASSESSSDSSSSSSPSDKESAYQRDIRDYTMAYAARGGDVDRFRHDLSAIAEDHGVSDWEADPATLVAIGSGVRSAHLENAHANQLMATLSDGDDARMQWMQRGYDRRLE